MGKGRYLTERVRLEQTNKKRIFRILDNELYQDDDGTIYIVPRFFQTDNYTIPLLVAPIGGSPVEYRIEPAHLHDLACDCWEVAYVTLTVDELKEKGYYRYSEKRKLWVCENIPKEYLKVKKVNKFQANNFIYRAMRAAGTPFLSRVIVRIGVCFNLNWYIRKWKGEVVPIDLDRFYDPEFWDEVVK